MPTIHQRLCLGRPSYWSLQWTNGDFREDTQAYTCASSSVLQLTRVVRANNTPPPSQPRGLWQSLSARDDGYRLSPRPLIWPQRDSDFQASFPGPLRSCCEMLRAYRAVTVTLLRRPALSASMIFTKLCPISVMHLESLRLEMSFSAYASHARMRSHIIESPSSRKRSMVVR